MIRDTLRGTLAAPPRGRRTARGRGARRDDIGWLLHTTNRMVRCRSVDALLDLAYDAIRAGLAYDRVGIKLVDYTRRLIVERIGTDEAGRKFYPRDRVLSLDDHNYYAELLADPHMQADGPGFIYLEDATQVTPTAVRGYLDGSPGQNLKVALRTPEKVVGLISVDNLTSGRPIVPEDAPPLVALANALASALENIGLLEDRGRRIIDLDAGLRRRVEQVTWLQEAGSRLALVHDLDGVLDAIYDSIRTGLGYDRAGVFLVDEEDAGAETSGVPSTTPAGAAPADQGRVLVARELRGTDVQGQPTRGSSANPMRLDDAELAGHSADLCHLLEGHAFYYSPDRWAATPPEYRWDLEGRMREQIAVALRHDDALVGYVSVDNLVSGRAIVEADAAALVAYAPQAALAISRARLWTAHTAQGKQLSRRVAELEWLTQTARRVNSALSLHEVLDVVYDGIHDGLGYDRVGINLFDYATGTFEEACGTDDQGRKIWTNRVVTLADDSPIWRFPGIAALLRGADFYYTADAYHECPAELRHLYDGTPKHNLMVPLRAGETVIGMISVDNLVSGRPITPDDAALLLALTNQVGTAVENARLHERERAERAQLEILLESTRALSSSLDQDHILRELAGRLVTALGATTAIFSNVDAAARTITSLVSHSTARRGPLDGALPGADGSTPPGAELAAFGDRHAGTVSFDTHPALEQVLQSRIPFWGYAGEGSYHDATGRGRGRDSPPPAGGGTPAPNNTHRTGPDPRTATLAGEGAFLREHGLYAELLVPVIVQGEASGILEVYWDHPVEIGGDAITLCTAIAAQGAVALENARLYADAAARAERDSLTGLLTHRPFLERLDGAVSAGAPFALLLLDVNNFKLFNDSYGHPVGDGVLLQVATTLQEIRREGDVAGRYGGDEFALLLRGATAAEAAAVVRRLSAAVRTRPHVTPGGAVIPLSIAIGMACFPADGRTRDDLVAIADDGMYAAKRGVGLFAPVLQERAGGDDGAPWRAADTPVGAPGSGEMDLPRHDPPRARPEAPWPEEGGGRWTGLSPRAAAARLGGRDEENPVALLQELVGAVDARDRYTREHAERATRLALLLAEALALPGEQRRALAIAAPLHDVGKIAAPERVLRKPGQLTDAERTALRRHVPYGVVIIRGVLDTADIVEIVAYHHERWDGGGYPYGVPGPATPLLGRIMQVSSAVAAMMIDRPYRHALPWDHVVSELRTGAGTQFDPSLVELFIAAASPMLRTAAVGDG